MTRVVVKVGGRVAADSASAVVELAGANDVCVVHGAGPQISADMERAGIPVEFVGGRRVTTREALEVVRRSFAHVNGALCAAIGDRAVGLFGDEAGLQVDPVPELGLVGEARRAPARRGQDPRRRPGHARPERQRRQRRRRDRERPARRPAALPHRRRRADPRGRGRRPH
jgi:hypothetical protein